MPELPAGRAAIRSLEERHLSTWPGLAHTFVDGWILRRADGISRRANSAWPLHAPTGRLDDRLAATERFFDAAGLESVIRVTALAEPTLDAALAARGYQLEDPSLVRLARLDRAAFDRASDDRDLVLADGPAEWLEAHIRLSGLAPAKRAAVAAIHGAMAVPCCYGLVLDDGAPAGCAFAALDRGVAAINSVAVDPARRRRGLAARLMHGLLAWAANAGATAAVLQVQGDNTPALALYSRLGFRTVYGYHYRAKRRPTPP